jgi:preprotein translocase subunit YajC
MLFITLAHADTAAAQPGNPLLSMAPIALMLVVFYFLLIRPQQKKAKEHQSFLETLKTGQTVMAAGGIFGKITKIKEDIVEIEIAPSVQISVLKGSVSVYTNPDLQNAPAKQKKSA